MAAAPSSLDNYLSCQVCFEHFEEDGDHVPRILPCHHTVCEFCIKNMIRGNKITCPECQEEHEAKKQEKSFQQNKYIVVQMSRKKKNEKEEARKVEICPEHGKEIIFFCEEESCKKPICKTCLTKGHKKHDFVDIEEKKKTELLKNMENIKKDLTQKISIISQAKDDVQEKTLITLNNLKKAKHEMNKKFDMMIKETENKMKEEATWLDVDAGMINENLLLLEQMKNNIAADTEVTMEGLTDGEETVADVINTMKGNICGTKTFNVKTFHANQNMNYGKFDEEAITVVLPDITAVEEPSIPGKPIPIVTDASKLKWKVMTTVQSELSIGRNIATLTDSSVAVVGKQGPQWMLKRFNMNDNVELCSQELEGEPDGLCEIQLGGRRALAVSYGIKQKIEFRSIHDLSQTIHCYSTGSLRSRDLCAASPSTLLFVDWSNIPNNVYWLDCSGDEPKLTGKKINTTLDLIWDMCYIPDEKKPLLVGDNGDNIFVYNVIKNKLEWSTPVGGLRVTTDGHNYVMVRRNNNISMLSLSDGKDMGYLIKEGDQGFGKSMEFRWCSKTLSFVVAHQLNEKYHISKIQFE